MNRRLLLPMLAFLAGCPSRPVGPSDWPYGATLDPAEPRLAYEPAPGEALDGPDPLELLWTGEHFVALYGVNDAGAVYVGLSLLSPEGELVDATRVTDDYAALEDAPVSAVMVQAYDAVTVLWSDGWGNIHARKVGTASAMLQPEPPEQPFDAVAAQVSLAGAVFENEGYTLAWLGDRAPRVSQLNGGLGRVGPIVEPVPDLPANVSGRITDLHATPGGFALLWNERTVQSDAVYVIRLHVNGQPDGEPILVYEAEDVISAELLVDGSELLTVAFWDLDVASGVVEIVDASQVGEPVYLSNGSFSRPTLDAVGESTYAMLGLAGELRPENPIETQLWFLLVERSGLIAHELRVSDSPAEPRCIEGHRIARGHDAFGALWVEGCAELDRQLLFARIVPQ
ncbi:MAG: hypothetical protein ABI333_29725 [bacterium]